MKREKETGSADRWTDTILQKYTNMRTYLFNQWKKITMAIESKAVKIKLPKNGKNIWLMRNLLKG